MSDEPTERDVEALARELQRGPVWYAEAKEIAARLLASDWYAGRIAQARREGAAEAIGDVADWINDEPPMRKSAYVERLRSQAKALRGDA